MYTVDVLFPGFPGKNTKCALGWGTVALIRDGTHNILLDTGGPQIRHLLGGMLQQYGLTFRDIDMVLITHLHFDHACNVNLFPHAQIVLSLREWEHANDLIHWDINIEESALPFIRNADVLFILEDHQEILPGLTALLTPGHTPGSTCYVISQGDERWVLAGDAAKNRGELNNMVVQSTLMAQDSIESFQKIKANATRILPGHGGWLTVHDDGSVSPEEIVEAKFVFAEGITVNGGLTEVTIRVD